MDTYWDILETVGQVHDRTCCNLWIVRQLFRSMEIGGIAQFFQLYIF